MTNYTESYNPITNEHIGNSRLHSTEDLKIAIKNARSAQEEWVLLSIKERCKRIMKIQKNLLEKGDEIAGTISQDNGKVRIDAYTTEIIPSIMAISYYCKKASKFLEEVNTGTGSLITFYKRGTVHRVPFGVIGIISPWNYPFSIPFSEVIIGLLTGNAVILKVASETQMVGLAIKDLIESAGIPKGLFSLINIPGRIMGEALLQQRIDKIFFTGSVAVGKILMEKAAKTLTPLCLELGGNDPMIICEDADLIRAARGAMWAGFSNCGQSCGSVERLYIHESVYDEFLSLLKKEVEKFRVGPDIDYNVDMGGMTTRSQIVTVNEHIEDALQKGASIYVQSKVVADPKFNNLLPAMVITNVNHDMKLMKDETFGPVIAVMKFKNITEAIRLANDSYLGLTASVWSKNSREAGRIARELNVGVVSINDHLMTHGLPETPWGGFKESGFGRTHGKLGFDEMTQPQTVVNDRLPILKRAFWWHPYNENMYQGFNSLVMLIYSSKLSVKLKALLKVHKLFFR